MAVCDIGGSGPSAALSVIVAGADRSRWLDPT